MQEDVDRRVALRHSYRLQAILQRGEEGMRTALSCHVHNVSATGAQLIFRGACLPDEKCFITLIDSRRRIVVERKAAIAWIREADPGVFRIGVRFEAPLSFNELQCLR